MKRRILKVWQFVLLLAMLMLIPQTMFFSVLHVDRDVAENIAEQLKDEAGESIKDNVFLSIAENILRFLWKEILSVGMYITFSLCILLLVVLVLITVTGNQCITIKKRELSASA